MHIDRDSNYFGDLRCLQLLQYIEMLAHSVSCHFLEKILADTLVDLGQSAHPFQLPA